MELQIFDGKIVCPRCDGNGLVYEAKVMQLNRKFLICDECEALWEDKEKLEANSFVDLSNFLEAYGFTYKEAEIVEENHKWLNK